MASITYLLFLSLLLQSVFVVKCDDEDDLLQGINQYRSSSRLPPLSHNERVECLADDIADRLKSQPCIGNTSAPQPRPSDYADLITKCRLTNATLQGIQILPVCLPESQSSQLLNAYTTSPYATYLNDTRFSGVGIGSDDDWTVVILIPATSSTPATPGTPATPSTPDEDDLLQGINQFRSSSSLPPLSHNERIECLADDIADRLKNQPCTGNTSAPQPKPSDYAGLITKCMLTNATLQGVQILPVCLPESQSSQLLNAYTTSSYASYLNDTRFSSIGIGSDDNWTVVILTTATSGTPATPTTPGTPATPTTPRSPATPGSPTTPDEDDLLQGINQFRSSSSLPPLSHNERVECLADDIADRLKNQSCTGNTSAPLPKPSDYADLIAKCMLTNTTLQGVQILPVCIPESQSSQLLNAYTTSPYANYLNDTRFSGIGIGSDDNWTVVILTTATPGTHATAPSPANPSTPAISPSPVTPATAPSPATPGTPATPTTPSISPTSSTPSTGSNNSDSGAASLTAISPIVVIVLSLSILF